MQFQEPILQWVFERFQEEEGGDIMKLREGNVKGRKHQMVKNSGTGFGSYGVCCGGCDSNIQSCKEFQCERCRGKRACSQRARNCIGRNEDEEDEEGEEEDKEFDEDEEDVIVNLRKELVKERKLRAWTKMELEMERRAASSAVEETMAKILLLQNEKGLIVRQFRQYSEMAEQKQAYDQEVIENMKWIILNLQEEKICMGKPTSDGQDD